MKTKSIFAIFAPFALSVLASTSSAENQDNLFEIRACATAKTNGLKEKRDCLEKCFSDKAFDDSEVTECQHLSAEVERAALAQVFERVQRHLRDQRLDAKLDLITRQKAEESLKILRASQDAFFEYSQKNCAFETIPFLFSNGAPAVRYACEAKLARDRQNQLTAMFFAE